MSSELTRLHRRVPSRAAGCSITAALALAIGACVTDDSPTEPGLSPSSAMAASGGYAVQDLGTLGGSYSYAFGIGPEGEVVGASATVGGQDHAFLWKNGNMTDLGTLVGSEGSSAARGANGRGEVVGQSTTSDGQARAFLWRNEVMTDLGTLDGAGSSGAHSINGVGQVVGYSYSGATGDNHAFLWENGVMADLGTLGGPWSLANDINNSGQVVGASRVDAEHDDVSHAFLWQNGVMSDLGTLGGRTSGAQGINEAGDVVGWSETAEGVTHAVVWKQGQIIDLGPFRGGQTFAYAINAGGLKVGFWSGSPGGPLVWEKRKPMRLETLGGVGGDAVDANDAGQIVGSSATSAGEIHAALWTK
jgi:probable HAF family extracellular repeat protein